MEITIGIEIEINIEIEIEMQMDVGIELVLFEFMSILNMIHLRLMKLIGNLRNVVNH
jgi:hypothetical protein